MPTYAGPLNAYDWNTEYDGLREALAEHLSTKKFFCYFSLASSSQEVNANESQAQKLERGGIPWRA